MRLGKGCREAIQGEVTKARQGEGRGGKDRQGIASKIGVLKRHFKISDEA